MTDSGIAVCTRSDEQERVPFRIRFVSETSRNAIVENTFREFIVVASVFKICTQSSVSFIIDLMSENN